VDRDVPIAIFFTYRAEPERSGTEAWRDGSKSLNPRVGGCVSGVTGADMRQKVGRDVPGAPLEVRGGSGGPALPDSTTAHQSPSDIAPPSLTSPPPTLPLSHMKAAALLALLVSLAVAPLAPAAVQLVPVAECAAQCCQTEPDCCATACPCPPLSCHAPAATSVLIPAAAQPLMIFAPGSSPAAQLTDDTCSQRTSRPPVPPPRA
jgi:hypothetical protein